MKKILIGCAVACSATACADSEPSRPNVLVILADDQGYGDITAHGNPVIETPNLDAFRDQCVRLTDFHVTPMSAPTRGQLMTGVDAMRNGCTAVCEGRSMPDKELTFMPEYFQQAGYSTGHFGKWHLGDSYPYRPQDRGFDQTLHFAAWGITSLADVWDNSYFDPVLNLNGENKPYKGYVTDIFFDNAMDYMLECKENNKPFFTYLALNTPHVPEMVAKKYSQPYAKIGKYGDKKVPSIFYGMIANIDENMGRLNKFMEENGLAENTIIIYSSDNGTQNKQAEELYNAGMRERKTSVYEGGHRVPMFIRWANGKLLHGKDVEQLAVVQDILPTLLSLCGIEADDLPKDGVDISSILKREDAKLDDRMKVIQYKSDGGYWSNAVVLWDKWRLAKQNELYNIEQDKGQCNNVAAQHPDIVKKMSEYYDKWYAEVKPEFDRKRYITIGAEQANPTMLYSNDWNGGYCDNRGGLFDANQRGYFDVEVASEGEYEFTINRWSPDSGLAFTDGVNRNDFRSTLKKSPKLDKEIAALPVAMVQLNVDDQEQTLAIKEGDTSASFRMCLPKGKSRIEGVLLDKNSKVICGAMYIKVENLSKRK